MKNIFLFTIVLSVCFSKSFSQNWIWAKTTNGGGQTKSVYADASGDVFVTGTYGGSIVFGSTTLTSSVASNIFIVKYDMNGNVIWSKSLGGGRGSSIRTDVSGNVFVTGSFDSPTITIGSTTLTNAGGYNPGSAGSGQGDPCTDMFIVKCDATGNVLWVKSTGGTGNEYVASVSTDPNGNVLVMGIFASSSITFDSITLTNSNSSGLNNNLFITKFDTNGNVIWAKSGLGDGRSMSTDAAGNIFLTGAFGAPLITKYDPNGNILWTKSGAGNAGGTSISANANGDVFLVGQFNGPTITFGSAILNSNGPGSGFFAKCDANGTLLWATVSGATDGHTHQCHSVCADAMGGAFVTGSFEATQPSISFGSITFTPPVGNCSPYCYPVFLVKYDANGNELCASALASGGSGGTGVSVDPNGNAYIAGGFDINPLIVGTDTLPLTDGESLFLAKYNCDFTTAMDELNNEKNISVYPNPSFGIFTINLKNKAIENKICVYDILGNCVIEKMSMKNSNEEIDLSKQSKGIFFVEIVAGQERDIQKIVLQ